WPATRHGSALPPTLRPTAWPPRRSPTARWTPSLARASALSCGCCCGGRRPKRYRHLSLPAPARHRSIPGPGAVWAASRAHPEIAEAPLALCPPDARADLVALSSCLYGKRHAVRARLDDLAFPAAERDVVAHTAESAGYLTEVFTDPEQDLYGPISDLGL